LTTFFGLERGPIASIDALETKGFSASGGNPTSRPRKKCKLASLQQLPPNRPTHELVIQKKKEKSLFLFNNSTTRLFFSEEFEKKVHILTTLTKTSVVWFHRSSSLFFVNFWLSFIFSFLSSVRFPDFFCV